MIATFIPPESAAAPVSPPPNFLIILADDLGNGDVSAFRPQGDVRTPNLDRLAADGWKPPGSPAPRTSTR